MSESSDHEAGTETSERPAAIAPGVPNLLANLQRAIEQARRQFLEADVVPVAPPAEDDGEHGLYVEDLPRFDELEDDQPPGIDPDDHELPEPRAAAERVATFVRGFGDGLILGAEDGLPPLYARDLEAIARAVLER